MSDKEYSFIKSYDEEDEEEPMILASADELIEIARDKHNSDGEVEIDEFLMEDGKAVKVGDFGISKVMDTAVGKDQMAMPDAEGRVAWADLRPGGTPDGFPPPRLRGLWDRT